MIELVKKIKAIIEAYHGNSEVIEKEIKDLVEKWGSQVDAYKMEYIQEQISNETKELLSSSLKVNKVYNQQLKVILDDSKKKVLPEYFNQETKPSDYGIQVSNALEFLKNEGEQITDETAYMILKDFIDDVDQMKKFKNFISKKIELEDAQGNSTFPKTFGKLNEVEMILNTFNEMESIANMLFIYPKENGQTFIVNGQAYSVPSDSYEQMADEDSIISFAEIIEEYASEIPEIEDITDHTEHQTIVE